MTLMPSVVGQPNLEHNRPCIQIRIQTSIEPIVSHLLKSRMLEILSAGRFAMHYAAGHRHRQVVQLLLDKGIDVEARDDSQRTALFNATIHGRKRIAHLLLEKGADASQITAADGAMRFTAKPSPLKF